MKRILFLTGITAALLLNSCNTMIGIGRDMRMGGEALESTAGKANGSSESSTSSSGAPVY